MAYRIRQEERGKTQVWVLEDDQGMARTEICPALGFNCYRWQAKLAGQPFEFIQSGPDLFAGGKPTRHGVPILFPFPNRIREGRFTWEGRSYELPLNGDGGKNAIHGFACQRPWRVAAQGADGQSAWITGEFRGSVDAADCRTLWPADYVLRVTYRLLARQLRIEAVVENPDRVPLPFGLGYHPYFRTAPGAGAAAHDCEVEAAGTAYWALESMLPTGKLVPADGARDLNLPHPFRDLTLDDVLTDVPREADKDGLCWRGGLRWPTPLALRVRTSADFRETVLFTAQNRESFCIEPYTCTTDALNLQQHGIDAGWRVLPPGEKWSGAVEMALTAGPA